MNATDDNLEVEVKFHIADPVQMGLRLEALDARSRQKVFESNIRFEDEGHTLKANHKLLRLRQDTGCRLTYKSKPEQFHSQCKVYRELEVAVSDFEAMKGILIGLGYHRAQTYEKWRQTFAWKDVEICLDTMPYGTFLEIEGPEPSIRKTARHLGLPWEKRILANYLGMFEALRRRNNLPFNDVTFANFEDHPADITPLLNEFEAGGS